MRRAGRATHGVRRPCACAQALSDTDRTRIEKRVEAAAKEGQRFERIVVSRDEALAMFTENKFKVRVWSGCAGHTPTRCEGARRCSWRRASRRVVRGAGGAHAGMTALLQC